MTQRIGEYLIRKRLLSPRDLTRALEEQKSTGEFLGSVLLRRGLIGETELMKAFAEFFKIPFVSLKYEYVDWDLALGYPPTLVAEKHCLPIRADDRAVTIAITNPSDALVMSQAEDASGIRKVKFVLTTPSEMREALKIYQKRVTARIQKLLAEEGGGRPGGSPDIPE